MSRASILLLLLTLLLSSWYLDASQNDNITSRAATVAAVVEHGTFQIDRFHELTGDKAHYNGHYYSEKAPLPALLVVPFHALFRAMHITEISTADALDPALLRLGGFLVGSVPFTLIIFFTWQLLRNGFSKQSTVVLLTFFGSFLFIYAGSFYGHLIGALFIVLAMRSRAVENHLWAGIWSGCAVLCEYPLVIFPLCWLLDLGWRGYRQKTIGPLFNLVKGGLPFLLFLLVYNALLFGSPFSMGYQHVVGYQSTDGSLLGAFDPDALFGLSFSMYRGLFPHMPILVLCIIAAWPIRKSIMLHPMEALIPSLVLFALVAMLGMWWGGWAFGPRHLTTVAVVLAYRMIPYVVALRWSRLAIPVFGGIGVLYAFSAKFTVLHGMPTGVLHPFTELILPALREGRWSEMQWPVLLGLSPGTANVLFIVIFALVLLIAAKYESNWPNAPVPLP